MVTIVNSTVLYNWKLLRVDLKMFSPHTHTQAMWDNEYVQ